MGFKNFIKNQYLTEKLILYNNGATYGQVVFLAGGAASGKGFSRESFMEDHKFKIRDVDEWKASFLKLQRMKGKYPELEGLDLRNPNDVFKLHTFVKKVGVKEKSLGLLLGNAHNPETLPNIMFDVTLKDEGDITEVIPSLLQVGYKKENIHITWILADYHVAVKANKQRSRVVPDDILLNTHEGAASTMSGIVNGKVPDGVDGDIRVVLNNREHTVTYGVSKNAAPQHAGKEFNIGGFTYITVKKAGKPISTAREIREKLHQWIGENVPKSIGIKHLFKRPNADHPVEMGANDPHPRQMAASQRQAPQGYDQQTRQMGGPAGAETGTPENSGLVTIHRRHGGRLGFAFKTEGRKIGFTEREAQLKIQNLKKQFPHDDFVTVPYNARKKY